MLQHLKKRESTKVSRLRGRPKRKDTAKGRTKDIANEKGSKKRATPQLSKEHATKVRKIEANNVTASIDSARAAKNRSTTQQSEGRTAECIISLISDKDSGATSSSKSPVASLRQPSWGFSNLGDRIEEEKEQFLAPNNIQAMKDPCNRTSNTKSGSSQAPQANNSHDQEDLDKLRAELDSQKRRAEKAEAAVEQLHQEQSLNEHAMQQKRADLEKMRLVENEMKQKITGLQSNFDEKERKLIIEKADLEVQLEIVQATNTDLANKLEAAKEEKEGLQKKIGDLQEKLEEEQDETVTADVLNSQVASLQQDLENEKHTHAETLKQIDAVQAENMCLKADLAVERNARSEVVKQLSVNVDHGISEPTATKSNLDKPWNPSEDLNSAYKNPLKSTPPPTFTTMSLASVSSSDPEAKVENVRKVYLKVKKKYDLLYSIAKKLCATTRGMNLGSFGEFGANTRQLRTALEECDGSIVGKDSRDGEEVMRID